MSLDAAPLETARMHLGLSVQQLWVRCVGLGGMLAKGELADSLLGRKKFAAVEYDVVAHALNERFMERGDDHPLPYSEDAAEG